MFLLAGGPDDIAYLLFADAALDRRPLLCCSHCEHMTMVPSEQVQYACQNMKRRLRRNQIVIGTEAVLFSADHKNFEQSRDAGICWYALCRRGSSIWPLQYPVFR